MSDVRSRVISYVHANIRNTRSGSSTEIQIDHFESTNIWRLQHRELASGNCLCVTVVGNSTCHRRNKAGRFHRLSSCFQSGIRHCQSFPVYTKSGNVARTIFPVSTKSRVLFDRIGCSRCFDLCLILENGSVTLTKPQQRHARSSRDFVEPRRACVTEGVISPPKQMVLGLAN